MKDTKRRSQVLCIIVAGLFGDAALYGQGEPPPPPQKELVFGNDLVLVRMDEAPGDEESAESPRVVIVRRQIAAMVSNTPAAELDKWLFGGQAGVAARKRFEAILQLKIEDIDECCGLSDAQKQKLRLAGEADIRRFFEMADDVRERLQTAQLRQGKVDDFVEELQLLRIRFDYDLLDGRSFFSKVLRSALTADQADKFSRIEYERRASRYPARLAATIFKLKEQLELRDEQCRALAQVLLEKTRPPRKSGPYDDDVLLWQMAQLPAAAFSNILDPAQRGPLQTSLERIADDGALVEKAGLLAEDEARPSPPAEIAVQRTADLLARLSAMAQRTGAPAASLPKRGWGPEQVVGPPDTLGAGDRPTAWASRTQDGRPEWLLCSYAEPVDVKTVMIHETFNPGAVNRISAFDDAGREIIVWEGADPTNNQPSGVSEIPVKFNFKTSRIRIHIDSPAVPGWNEIDAVGLCDTTDKVHWARKVTASSTFASGQFTAQKRPHSPEQVAGPPDALRLGDNPAAWASQTPDGQPEWLICHYAEAVDPRAVAIHESFNPGAVTKVSVFDERGNEVVAWEGVDPTPRTQPGGISFVPIRSKIRTARIKIYLESPSFPGYNEIDAVGLLEASGETQWAQRVEASSTFGIGGAPAAPVGLPAAELARVRRLEAEVIELRNEITRLKKLQTDLEELKRALKERGPQ